MTAPTSGESAPVEGIILQAAGGLFRVGLPGGGELVCRARGRLRGRRGAWRDARDAERQEAALDPGDEDELDAEPGAAEPEGAAASPAGPAPAPRRAGPTAAEVARATVLPQPGPGSTAPSGPGAVAPLPGDRVLCKDLGAGEGVIDLVLPRQRTLVRPPIANADVVVVVTAWEAPPFSAAFVDRVLLEAAVQGCGAIVCVNKCDVLDAHGRAAARAALEPFAAAGYAVLLASAAQGDGVAELRALLHARLAVLSGPSGSGKSRLLGALVPGRPRRSGELSRRAGRGRHTTRSVELLPLPGEGGGYIADTPGFSRLGLEDVAAEDLPLLYPEYLARAPECRFRGCLHDAEPGCAVRAAVAGGALDAARYERYVLLLGELRARPPRW